jgi:hypothetical protein
LNLWIQASLCCWRSVSFSAFFHSAKRAPLRSLASCLLLSLRAWFQIAADLVQRVGGELYDVIG